ncbi:MAG: 5'/3'-nucleotidase SurE [Planctomycetia bacterium]|nr:5'/3'-nucleotidase SurE [Planctomycetia bacterium]
MRFLITNDDGIDSPGLEALVRAVAELGASTVVAPDRHLSGCGHQTTTDRALALTQGPDGRHVLDGTPVDCIRIALAHVEPDVDWVISGINEGGNLGADLYRSGTVAAVREAALLGKPGIAVSQYRRRGSTADWGRAARWTADVIRRLLAEPTEHGVFWNVNLPDQISQDDPPKVVVCPMDPHPLPVGYRLVEGRYRYCGNYHERPRHPGHDVDVCFSGAISVTRFCLPPQGPATGGSRLF